MQAPFAVTSGERSFTVSAPGADLAVDDDAVDPRLGRACRTGRDAPSVSWSLALDDPTLVVRARRRVRARASSPPTPGHATRGSRAGWMSRSAISTRSGSCCPIARTTSSSPPERRGSSRSSDATRCGRRASRCRSTPGSRHPLCASSRACRATASTSATAQQPGKIPHELRSAPLALPGEGVLLPPLYYGTVDATPLWVCLLADAFDAGMPRDEVRRAAAGAARGARVDSDYGDGSGHGFIDYIDETGHGLANQGWKDSGDSIQWRDGSLARGPIALCEVQGYAYEAAIARRRRARRARARRAATRCGNGPRRCASASARRSGSRRPRAATRRRARRRPAARRHADEQHRAPDRHRHPRSRRGAHVAALLLGAIHVIGVRHPDDVDRCRRLLAAQLPRRQRLDPRHRDRVHGMSRAGLHDEALQVVDGLLAAAEGFGFRMPELHSGDPAAETRMPTPYPAACRPQAWSAAAAVACAEAVRAAGTRR